MSDEKKDKKGKKKADKKGQPAKAPKRPGQPPARKPGQAPARPGAPRQPPRQQPPSAPGQAPKRPGAPPVKRPGAPPAQRPGAPPAGKPGQPPPTKPGQPPAQRPGQPPVQRPGQPPARPPQGGPPASSGPAAAAAPPPSEQSAGTKQDEAQRPASRPPPKDTSTRQVSAEEAKEGPSGLKRIPSAEATGVIGQRVAQRAVRPGVVKVPQFPPPASERPVALKEEERRREQIAEKERQRREEIISELDEQERIRIEHDWAIEDALSYRADPYDREVEIYAIREPHAYVQIIRNERSHEMLYHVIEPRLSRDEKLLLDFIEKTMVDVLDLQPSDLEKGDLKEYIEGKFDEVMYDYSIRLGDEEASEAEARERILYYIYRDFTGEGPLDVFMQDDMIEDISCDGPHVPIFVYHRKYESLTTTVRFRGHDDLDSFVIRMAQRAGKHVSIAEPILDATMRDGSRLQSTLAKEVSSFGSTFTIRKFRDVPFTPIDLVRFGTMSSHVLAYLWMIIEFRMSAIYAGGTASGKTTAINAIMLFIPPQLKVITIEDTREIQIPQPNWIAGVTRSGFGPHDEHGRQAGEIDMFQLLKNALRQRPEYIIVGEVRGAEAYNLFQAMATGHAAYGTMHADSVEAVIHRLDSDPINIPRALLEALDVVCVQQQTRVEGKRVRRTKQVTEIVGLDPNTRELLTNEVFHWEPATDSFHYSGVSYVLERIAAEAGLTTQQVSTEMENRVRIINWLVDTDLRDYKTIANVVATFYKDKERVLKAVEEGRLWE